MTIPEAIKFCEGYLPECDTKKFVIEQLKKQLAKKAIITRYYQGAHGMLPDLDDAECPNCGAMSVGMGEYGWEFGFCINCGQKILWEDDEE